MVITIGAFDGFHKGHAELFRKCREISSDWGVVTFEPHPAEFMGRIKPLFRLKEK
ncbi:MAG: riboflavin biosynthesis protein RibF, partial [Synergistaceae bacterium]|nr:riboflavin biosynthesis protein RibF [Synergistaceae bacterium]